MSTPFLERWEPPRGFSRTRSPVPGIAVAEPVAQLPADTPAVRSFSCPRCAATLAYDPTVGGVACEHCGFSREAGASVVGHRAIAHEFTNEALRAGTQGWGVERRELSCADCGAAVSIPGGELSTRCPCCSSTHVRVNTGSQQARPGHVLPMSVTPEQAGKAASAWLGKGWMHPAGLARMSRVGAFTPMYVPFWLFQAGVTASWRCQVGTDYRDSEGNTQTRWKWREGHVDTALGTVRIPGSERVSTVLQARLSGWDLGKLTDYDPDFLVGVQALVFDQGLPESWEKGKNALRERTRARCRSNAGGDRVRKMSIQADLRDEAWQYVLLPVHVGVYRFRGSTWQVLVCGDSAEVVGQKPVARWKVWGVIVLMWGPGLFTLLLSLILMLFPPTGFIALVFAAVFLLFAFVGSRQVLRSAAASEAA